MLSLQMATLPNKKGLLAILRIAASKDSARKTKKPDGCGFPALGHQNSMHQGVDYHRHYRLRNGLLRVFFFFTHRTVEL